MLDTGAALLAGTGYGLILADGAGCRREKALRIELGQWTDLALVDVALQRADCYPGMGMQSALVI